MGTTCDEEGGRMAGLRCGADLRRGACFFGAGAGGRPQRVFSGVRTRPEMDLLFESLRGAEGGVGIKGLLM